MRKIIVFTGISVVYTAAVLESLHLSGNGIMAVALVPVAAGACLLMLRKRLKQELAKNTATQRLLEDKNGEILDFTNNVRFRMIRAR